MLVDVEVELPKDEIVNVVERVVARELGAQVAAALLRIDAEPESGHRIARLSTSAQGAIASGAAREINLRACGNA